ncbi:MAG: hypothetical protein AAFZ15_34595 [Bacteroidota bacterium]
MESQFDERKHEGGTLKEMDAGFMTDKKSFDHKENHPIVPFEVPVSIIISGPSQCGKTTWLVELLKHKDTMFSQKIEKVMLIYEIWHPLYESLETYLPGIEFSNRIPSREEIDLFCPDDSTHNLIVFDDQISNMASCKHFSDFFLILCNNRKLSCILTVQNIFSKCRGLRDISLNARALVIFKNLRSLDQINLLGSQMFGQKKNLFVQAFQLATSKPYGCLTVDLSQRCDPKLQLRSNILPGEGPVICYIPKG